MKVVRHEMNSVIRDMSREELLQVLEQALNLHKKSKAVYNAVRDYADAEERGEHDEFDFLDFSDELCAHSSVNVSTLATYSACRCSTNLIVNKYLASSFTKYDRYTNWLDFIVKFDGLLELEKLREFQELAYEITSSMTFFISIEFGLYGYTGAMGEVDSIVSDYCAKHTSETPEKLAEMLCEDAKVFKIRFEVFDAFDGLEERFLELMGPDLIAIDPELLTVEQATKLCNGEITPQELVAMMNEDGCDG